MTEPRTTQYRTNHATFELPEQLKDKTVHMFTLNDSGPSEFSVVMTYAEVQPDESLADVGERLEQEMRASLPRFELARSMACLIDGAPALDLHYSWRSDGHLLRQRQLIVLVPGAVEGSKQAMMIGATCMRAFTAQWHAAFESVLDSLRWRHQVHAEPVATPEVPAASAKAVFALSEQKQILRLFGDQEEACRRTDAQEVEEETWSFFNQAGEALQARFVIPNSGTLWFKAGTYVLDPRPHGRPLLERVHLATIFMGNADALPLASIADVTDYLDRMRRS